MRAYVDYTDGRMSNVRLRWTDSTGQELTSFLITTDPGHAARIVTAVNTTGSTGFTALLAAVRGGVR